MLRIVKMIGPWIVLAGVALAATAQAGISADLAKKCRALAVEAHPTEQFVVSRNAELQRRYFGLCVARNGDMPPDATTGSGSRDDR